MGDGLPATRRCPDCGQERPLQAFHLGRTPTSRQGRQTSLRAVPQPVGRRLAAAEGARPGYSSNSALGSCDWRRIACKVPIRSSR